MNKPLGWNYIGGKRKFNLIFCRYLSVLNVNTQLEICVSIPSDVAFAFAPI